MYAEAMGGGANAERTPQDSFNQTYPQKDGQPRDLVGEVRDRLTEAFTFDRNNREDAVMDLKFLAGDQWPEYARAARVNRPMLTINKLPQFLHQITNDIRQSAPSLKVTPVDGKADPSMAKVYDGIISDIQYRCSAKHVYATAAYHAAACGIGHFRVITRYADDATFDQDIAIESVPYPLAVYWDPAAVKPDRSDAMWCIVVDLVPRATFKLKYPDAQQISVNELRANNFASGLFWTTQDYILVAEYWCKHPVERTICAFENGETYDTTDLSMVQLVQLQQTHGQVVAQRKAKSYKVEQSLVTGAEVLSGPHPWPGKYLPIVPVIGTEVPLERVTIRKGLIRDARDAMQLYNFYRSAAAEAIALAPKAPWLVTDTMIAQHKGDWNTANTQNRPFLRYTPDQKAPGMAPQRIHPPEPPQALWEESRVATEDLKATTGIYDASLGAKSNETSGIAIKRREQQGDTANYHYTDNLQRSLEHCGRILIDLIPKVYDNERVVRLLGEDGTESFVPINHVLYSDMGEQVMVNDLSVGRFDIRVTIGPSYATKRLEAAAAIVEIMQALGPEVGGILADIAVRNLDIPDAQEAAQRIRNMLPQQALQDPNAPPPDPMADPMARAELAGKFATAHKTMADANKTAIETQAMFGMMAPPVPPPLPPEIQPMGGPPMPGMMPPRMDQGPPMMPGGEMNLDQMPLPQPNGLPPGPLTPL
jgi:hypothetical protein